MTLLTLTANAVVMIATGIFAGRLLLRREVPR
jgi:hypothetical protein